MASNQAFETIIDIDEQQTTTDEQQTTTDEQQTTTDEQTTADEQTTTDEQSTDDSKTFFTDLKQTLAGTFDPIGNQSFLEILVNFGARIESYLFERTDPTSVAVRPTIQSLLEPLRELHDMITEGPLADAFGMLTSRRLDARTGLPIFIKIDDSVKPQRGIALANLTEDGVAIQWLGTALEQRLMFFLPLFCADGRNREYQQSRWIAENVTLASDVTASTAESVATQTLTRFFELCKTLLGDYTSGTYSFAHEPIAAAMSSRPSPHRPKATFYHQQQPRVARYPQGQPSGQPFGYPQGYSMVPPQFMAPYPQGYPQGYPVPHPQFMMPYPQGYPAPQQFMMFYPQGYPVQQQLHPVQPVQHATQ